ncbi:MAG: hypothetical protein K9G33_04620 [Sneathiella sp.]|nr:hypothetical protein [Sneathiella sp.]
MAVNDKQDDGFQQAESTPYLEDGKAAADLAFLDIDHNGSIDLAALFDALNIVADNGSGAMDFVMTEGNGDGKLIISGSELALGVAPAPIDDLIHPSDGLLKSNIVSDES